MSSYGTTENPTPRTSSTSKRQLKQQLKRNNNKLREMKNLFN
ncbi:uncharacterized protein CTRU02_207863 [Colletotrichum truncatum]|uniref:Uncharacterized protein n=1 Tax=Colletotrichum truncatum TaxID=5467 RepID=A0ACC3Z229_COLTU